MLYTKIVPEETKIDFTLDCSQVKVSIKECLTCFLVFNSIYSTCGSICSNRSILKFSRNSVFVVGAVCGRVSIKRFEKIKKVDIVSVNPFVMPVAFVSVFARSRRFSMVPNKHRKRFFKVVHNKTGGMLRFSRAYRLFQLEACLASCL